MTHAKLLAIPAVLAALAAAAPAAAYPHRTDGEALRRDIAQLENRLDRLDDTRRISGREEARLDRSIDQLKRTWSRYARDGFTRGERQSLSAQIDRVRYDLQRQARDRNDHAGRYDRDRWDHRDDRRW
jgi:hypothetical protein